MAKLDTFKKCVTDFKNIADFITIYIDEAHPTDGWAFNNNPYAIAKHVDIESRMFAAGMLAKQNLGCPLLVDTLSNETNDFFSAIPEKLIIIDAEGKLSYVGAMGPQGYKVEDVNDWLECFRNEKKSK